MYILSYYTGHTATAALLYNGKIIAAASEERFRNQKNYLGFPAQSIGWCLEFAGITAAELDLVVRCGLYGAPIHVVDKKSRGLSFLSNAYNLFGLVRSLWRTLVNRLTGLRPLDQALYRFMTRTLGRYTVAKEKKWVADWLAIDRRKIIAYEHHELHAASAYYASPYSRIKALVLTLDAEGDHLCATVSIYEKNVRQRLAATSRENSLGWLFLYVTAYLGMKPMEHEYKVMGLAPYAKTEHVNALYAKIKSWVILDPKNRLKFYAKISTYTSLPYLRRELQGTRFDNVAGAFQKLLEERMVEWTAAAIKATGLSKVIFSGGLFMNVKANQRLANLPGLKAAFFMPSAGDESLPIGGCYAGYLKLTKGQKLPAPLNDLYLGMAFTNEAIDDFIVRGEYAKKYKITRLADIETKIGQLLAEGKIVARLAGRMEWGARALGNRSILADPRDPDVVRIINEQLKNRDFWMPFAPSILAERLPDYCIVPKKIISPYMTLSYDTTALGKRALKAAMHPYDSTVRAQAVMEAWNPRYYRLIQAFEHETGIGAVLNTSFNLHGYPIVSGPTEALAAFEGSGLEYLALENYLISKL